MPQNINLNVAPYYDDFDPNKNYKRVLFKPGVAVQARELTTLQSILQNQIEKFGQHFFKDGAMVIPGNIGYDSEYTCVEVDSIHLGIPVVQYLSNLIGKTIKGETSGVTAKVENVITENESERKNNTLYIKYQSSSQSDFTNTKFLDGENLVLQEDVSYSLGVLRQNNTIATTIITNSNSIGSAVKIASGVYYIRGFFLDIQNQTLILDQYSNNPSYRVGLLVKESFATASNEYADLLDNSQGYYNFAAPGADRLVIETELIKKPLDDFNDENFVQLLRLENGTVESIVKNTDYNKFLDELARRTYDESGDYYIKPFEVNIKESLNNYLGNNGIYDSEQLTKNGNIPSDNLACLSISPGKAYVRGYEIETISNTIIDYEKPRTTDMAINESSQFNFGTRIQLNNVYGYIPVGFTTSSYVKLYNRRTDTVGVATGTQIGVARLYDLKLSAAAYKDASTTFDASLYDIQTYTTLQISSGFSTSYPKSTHIEGKNSGANGFLVSGITTTTTEFNLYQVSGNFIKNESLIINGTESNRILKKITDHSINDVCQITSYKTTPITFTADTVLSRKLNFSNNNSSYTISENVGNISTITTSNQNFYSNIKVDDVISYTKPNENLPTYNIVKSVSPDLTSATISGLTTVTNVNIGELPNSSITLNDLNKVTVDILNNSSSLYSELNHDYVSSVDLTSSSIIFRKTIGPITITNSSVFEISVFEGVNDSILVPFDEEAYTLTYSDGTIESLTSQKLTANFDASNNPAQGKITLRNLSASSTGGDSYLIVSYQKLNCKSRRKTYNRCASIVINKTNSGINTVGTGLSYSGVYGCRIEDNIISLNVPEVDSVLGIFESQTSFDPTLPSITLSSINGNINNVIKGERIKGESSKSIATLVTTNLLNQAQFCYLNDNVFIPNETITFEESGVTAVIGSISVGDNNILKSYTLDDGSRSTYLDFSRIVRKNGVEPPTRKIKIIYNHYSVDSNDNGSFVTVNSYDQNRYKFISKVDGIRYSDILDFRPRVTPYNTSSSISPFEFESRIFDSNSSSSPSVVTNDTSVILSYDYYLPRIDKLLLNKNGVFNLVKGVPSLSPKVPDNLDYSLEIATIYSPSYVLNLNEVKIVANTHKRYTMKDISLLNDRLSNVEYYTSLSLLELDTQNLTITDPDTNLNRFKSGFFVDNFSTADAGEIDNPIYRASVDIENRLLRPQVNTSYLDLELDTSLNSNVKKVGNVVCLNYNEVQYVQNPFATRTENVNPFNVISWVGNLTLSPSTDIWSEKIVLDSNVNSIEGNYLQLLTKNNINPNTNLGPIQWGNWTNTKGKKSKQSKKNKKGKKGRTRTGTQTTLEEIIDTVELADTVLSSEVALTMRSRNIGILANTLKPNTRFYAFFDNVNVTNYITPKIIEIQMTSGAFAIGEVVEGIGTNSEISFKLAAPNHKSGNIINPTTTYTTSPYNSSISLPTQYSATSIYLNVDVDTLNVKNESDYFGYVSVGMVLRGKTSGAVATVKDLRIITDSSGSFIGSFFIPDPKVNTNTKFTTGTKTFTLTTSQTNNNAPLPEQSLAESNFTSVGTIENVETNILNIRNGKISVGIVTSYASKKKKGGYKDPLAQSFEVLEEPGIFITKCEIFFNTKDKNNIPVTLQIRTMQNGVPTQTILPFAEVVLEPNNVIVPSDLQTLLPIDQTIPTIYPTTFTFPSPVYLEGGNEYCIVLISASNEYTVWISRMGEVDVANGAPNGGNVIVSQQPVLGSLFKSQNASTWDASQYEDLKFALYRADFTSTSGSINFYNPSAISQSNTNQITTLFPNLITSYSRSLFVKLSRELTPSEVTILESGYDLTQQSNSTFKAKVKNIVGTMTTNYTLNIVNSGIGFTSGITTYNNVDLVSLTGIGVGAKAKIEVGLGTVSTATVTSGGNGYKVGDVLSIDYKDTGNYGSEVVLTIPSTSGILTASNSIVIDEVQGELTVSSGNLIINGNTLSGVYPKESPEILSDGLHLKVNSSDHGLYSENNFVTISGVNPDTLPTKLLASIKTSSSEIQVEDASGFIKFEGAVVGIATTGYLKINNEIIGYTGVNTSVTPNVITINTTPSYSRGVDGTTPTSHFTDDLAIKYEFNGISLRKINTSHSLADVDYSKYSIDLDTYYVKIPSDSNKYFNKTKSGNSTPFASGFYIQPRCTRNITYSTLRPVVNIITPGPTEVQAKVRTYTSTSVNGNEISFVDKGFENFSLSSDNNFSSMRGIFSRENELEYIDSNNHKSLTLQIELRSKNSLVSPIIDLERVGMISIMNRINNPIEDYATDSRVNKLFADPNYAIYVSEVIDLEKPADSLKVLFDAYRHSTNEFRVAYRLFRNDTPDEYQLYELFPGYGNIDAFGNTIDPSKNNGLSDRMVTPSGKSSDYKSYEYNVRSPVTFTGFQIKIIMTGTDQANVPKIRDLRAIATL